MKPLENSNQLTRKRRRYSHGRSQSGRRIFRCCHAIETSIQLFEPRELRSIQDRVRVVVVTTCTSSTTCTMTLLVRIPDVTNSSLEEG